MSTITTLQCALAMAGLRVKRARAELDLAKKYENDLKKQLKAAAK